MFRRLPRTLLFFLITYLCWKGSAAVYYASPLLAAACPEEWLFVGVPLLLSLMFWRRWVCRWVCPMGFLQGWVRQLAWKGILFPNAAWIGKTLAVVSLVTLFTGGVSFLWLDPFVIYSGTLHGVGGPATLAVLLLLLAYFVPTLWCGGLCPCGAAQEMVWRLPRLFRVRGAAGRRSFLKMAGLVTVGVLCGGLLKRLVRVVPFFRPPGAVQESLFLSRCTRCGNCVNACPTGLLQIVSDVGEAYGTPQAEFYRSRRDARVYCDETCVACTEVCPTSALSPLTVETKKNFPIGIARLNFSLCKQYYQHECDICGRECPTQAISFAWSEEEYCRVPVINSQLCTGCGRCAAYCPGTEEENGLRAIEMERITHC
ncbi:MAG: 4Fe-4S binding protein [Planctomycetia bacterium]|nr:4Fe-4S binding protein [Planctomycetia bacterium]